MTPEEYVAFVESYQWVPLLSDQELDPLLTVGYLRNNGIIARVSKKAPISMFRIGQKISLWVAKEQAEAARDLISDLSSRYTDCPSCGHVLLLDEDECSYCVETGTES
jgi:hypothetical protein